MPTFAEVMAERLRARRINAMPEAQRLELRELYRDNFRAYIRASFEVVEKGDAYAEGVRLGRYPPSYVHGWHIDAMGEHLQAVAKGQIRRLLINVPPDSSKSNITCVQWPTWLWGRWPWLKYIFSSYSEDFTKRDARKSKQLIESDWYGTFFPEVQLADTPDTQLEYHTTQGGERHGASTNSGVTGLHVHGIVEDDPLKAQDINSPKQMEEAWTYHTSVLGFRLLPVFGWRVMVMQRLHPDDPSGRILKNTTKSTRARMEEAARRTLDAAGEDLSAWVHLCLPMEFEEKQRCRTRLPFVDPRKEDGELLWPERVPEPRVAELKAPGTGLGAAGWAAQGQQRPGNEEDAKVQKSWWLRYRELPKQFEMVFTSWDMKLKEGGKSWVSGQAWGRQTPTRVFKLYAVRFRGDILKTLAEFLAMLEMFNGETLAGPWPGRFWPRATAHLVENAANGPAVMELLRSKIPGLIPVNTGGASKAARLAAVTPFIEAKNCLLPEDDLAPWKGTSPDEFMQEVQDFPNGSADDQVDSCSQGLHRAFDVGKRVKKKGAMGFEGGERKNPWEVG